MIQKFISRCPLHLIFICMALGWVAAYGQESDYEIYREIREKRTLGNHFFTPITTSKSPFILTHIRTSLGIGQISNIRTPLVEVGDNRFLYQQGDIFAALLSFEYQHAVKNWLAVYLDMGLVGKLGSDLGTLVTEGANYATTFNIGWLIKVLRKEKFVLSANFGLTNGNYSFISIQNFVDEIINKVPDPSLIKSNNSLFGIIGIKAAYGVSELLGFNVSADLGYGETIQRELDNKIFTTSGFNTDLNLSDVIQLPVSLSLGFLYSNYPKGNADKIFDSNVFLIQLSYIGRTNFILGLEVTLSRELLDKETDAYWLNSLMFSTRYIL